MRHHLRQMFFGTLIPVVGGTALGATGAAVYSVLCTSLYWLITSRADALLPLLLRFSTAGAAAGGIIGICLAFDWAARDTSPSVGHDRLHGNRWKARLSDTSNPSAMNKVGSLGPATAAKRPGSQPDNAQLLARFAARNGSSSDAASLN